MKRKKVIKMRGGKTHGYGSKKKHRGAGSRGGRGYAGSKRHRKFWIIKNEPDHFGKGGFKSLKSKGMKPSFKSINLKDIEKIKRDVKEINMTELGYDKVLGSGEIKKPITIKASSFSKRAKEKIEKSGGKAEEI